MGSYLFSGLKVIDAATVIAAPAAAMMLAEYGADVIKIEHPDGDFLRRVKELKGQGEEKEDYMWQLDGRNKRGIVLDLRSADGMEVLLKLAAQCDVFITNQPFAMRDKFGFNYEDLRELNPGMIYASLSAYGEQGPERNRKAFDQIAYWARSGLLDMLRWKGVRPVQGLSGMGDHPTAMTIYAGIVTALLHRERTGEGSYVHTSLMANGLWSNAATTQGMLSGGDTELFRKGRTETPGVTMGVYRCSDDRWLQFNMVRGLEEFTTLLLTIDATDLIVRFGLNEYQDILDNSAELGLALKDAFLDRSSDEWLTIFKEAGLEVNRVGRVEELATDIQAFENDMIVEPTDPEITMPLLVKHPLQISSLSQVEPKRSPRLGEHAEEILRELGYDDAAIKRMRDEGVI
ncbi:MAG TPA: carnitine dehydratase [Gammaproteobacteria bacterium]|nr:carnitine dehydratase [Gammaproteobacteria bacterium]